LAWDGEHNRLGCGITMIDPARAAIACLILGVWALPAGAGVKLKVLPDGSKVMYNERSTQRVYRAPPRESAASRQEIDGLIAEHSHRQRLDPDLVRAVIQVESGYQPWAQSHKGAMGLMQLMPATARRLAVSDPWDPAENIRGGTTYLRRLLDEFDGRLELALAGYNAGPANVNRYGAIPPFEETRDYVEKVLRIYRNDPGYSLQGSPVIQAGRKTHLIRDEQGRYVLTTTRTSQR